MDANMTEILTLYCLLLSPAKQSNLLLLVFKCKTLKMGTNQQTVSSSDLVLSPNLWNDASSD